MEGSTVRQRKVPIAEPTVRGQGDQGRPKAEELQPAAGWMLLCRVCLFVVILMPLMLVIIVVLALPSPIDPIPYKWKEPRALKGALKPNDYLTKAEKLFENQLSGPESIIYNKGHFYTGTWDGKILHIEQGSIRVVAQLGKKPEGEEPCGEYNTEPFCGRPLGMRFDKDGYLIVADTYLGLYKVNVATGDAYQYFPSTMIIEEDPPMFLNDLDITSDGTIYVTDSSGFQRREFIYDVLEGRNNGRLIKFEPGTNYTEVMVSNMAFANGVQLSRDEDYILIAETTALRIGKFHLQGPKKGQWELFADNLPGMPDNIRLSSSGGYWVAMGFCRYQGKFSILDLFYNRPWIRKYAAKLPPWVIAMALKPCSMLVELNKKGDIVRTLMDLEGGTVQWPSEVEDVDGTLYVGSYRSPYIAKVPASVTSQARQKKKKSKSSSK